MPMPDIEMSVEMLGPQERGFVLHVLADQCWSKDARFLPNYWKREEYEPFLRVYGRTILRKHYAESDKAFTLVVPNDEETQTIWDFFHQAIPRYEEPWFVHNRHYNLNHRGLLLKRNWEEYHKLFQDLAKPGYAYQHLVPHVKSDLWVVDETITSEVPMECIPPEWKAPDIG